MTSGKPRRGEDVSVWLPGRLSECHRTQAWLANRLDVREATVGRWCRGEAWPPSGTVRRLRRMLNARSDVDTLAALAVRKGVALGAIIAQLESLPDKAASSPADL